MTEYAVMKDSKLEKIVYVLAFFVHFPYLPIVINSVCRMASNLLISWARLECQVFSLIGESFR
jgi:hypothetical protein